jgi:hypothetical protein
VLMLQPALLLLLLLLPRAALPAPAVPALQRVQATVGDIWSQLSTWGPCDAVDGCAWHRPVTAESAEAAAPYLRRVSLFAATGGCFSGYPGCSADRDLLADPRNASSAVDAAPLLTAMAALLEAGLQVRVVTGSVPIALSMTPPVIGSFGFNTALPASMQAYRAYIAEIARQIVARFGLQTVAQSVSFGVFTEANNADWLNASATEYAALYDATVCGLLSAIPAPHLTVGAHLTVDYGRWDASAFIQHAWNGTCGCVQEPVETPSTCRGVQLDYLGVSFYEAAAGTPGDLSAFERVALGLRNRALAVGFGASGDDAGGNGCTAGRQDSTLEFGIEEGRILAGPDGLQLGTHALGDDYQVSWDGLLFARAVRSGLSYVARWSVNSQMAGPYGVQGMSADAASQQQRLDNGAANLARLSMRMAADTFLPNSSATMLPLPGTSTRSGGGFDRSMVDVVASTNCPDTIPSVPTQGCVIRLLMVHHFTALDAGAAARNVTATVCGLPGVVQTDGTSAEIGAGVVSRVGGGIAVWWRDWWADAARGNLSAASGDYLPGLSSWADEPPLASTRSKQIWTARVSAYRAKAALRRQVLSNSECKVSEEARTNAAGGCVSCTLEMAAHSVALLELSVGRSSSHKATDD